MKSPLGIPVQGLAVFAMAMALQAAYASAGEPGWASQVLVSPPVRAQVESTPIPLRPYRPFHFYGNTVRRIHYRGTPIPSASDFWQAARVLTRQPYVPVESMLPQSEAPAADETALQPPEPSVAPDTTTRPVSQPTSDKELSPRVP